MGRFKKKKEIIYFIFTTSTHPFLHFSQYNFHPLTLPMPKAKERKSFRPPPRFQSNNPKHQNFDKPQEYIASWA